MPPVPATKEVSASKTTSSPISKENLTDPKMKNNYGGKNLQNNQNNLLLVESENNELLPSKDSQPLNNTPAPLQIVYRNVLLFIYLHVAALYGAYLWVSGQVMLKTFLWGN